ncbi:MAG: tRNA (uridine(34)/cytosine(34)/5-carboxymethylaminomethyluridine(34)-2'-O)-methyltransferase TrmL [Verrucomicrobia bacterium RIFCSPLOWO2_12_FULL_64_8]|nr:MAG: tRNA (uridine(34)/cytosine(34)/5-carboxymethylaminomethyluridine(34)-2'-O)-methyltransferase TrmL [Verrucomicrobia bacterium RIFCSPLOWO2_12_FULL_64_8]
MLHIVLFAPQIPQNTGNVGRLCAVTGSRLHLVHPLGFRITDRHLKRAGMDYWHALEVYHHADWAAFRQSPAGPRRLWLFTTKSGKSFWDVRYLDGDGLLFGNEGEGCPPWLHEEVGASRRVRIPHVDASMRSLNLSTAVGIACYEALRQVGMPKGENRIPDG